MDCEVYPNHLFLENIANGTLEAANAAGSALDGESDLEWLDPNTDIDNPFAF